MIGIGIGEILVLALVAVVVLLPAAVLASLRAVAARRDEVGRPAGVVEAMRHARATSAVATAGFLATLLVGVVTSLIADSPRLFAIIPLAASAAALSALALGELWGGRAASTRRTTVLNARTARQVAWGGWLRGGTASASALVGVAVACGVFADTIRGRVVVQDLLGLAGWGFPGWESTGPQLAGLGVLVALWAVAVRLAVLRPTLAAADVEVDNALRRASAARATRAALAGIWLALGCDLLRAGTSAAALLDGYDAALTALSLCGGLLALTAPLLLLAPSARPPRADLASAFPAAGGRGSASGADAGRI